MKTSGSILAVVLALVAAPASAQDLAQNLPKNLARKEHTARKQAARELIRLAKYCRQGKAYALARAEFLRALALHPDRGPVKRENKKYGHLSSREGTPRAGFRRSCEKKRRAVHASCVKRLAGVALLISRRGFPERFEHLARLAAAHFPLKDVRSRFKVVWFDPYRRWVHPATARKLRSGQERIDGKWVSRAEVEKLDAAHRTWDNPWIVSDEVHEVRTTLGLRSARRILGHISVYRRFVLDHLRSDWDFRPPEGKLPVIVTATRAELMARMQNHASDEDVTSIGGAFYLQTSSFLNPCFVTLEYRDAVGQTLTLPIDKIYLPLQHEIAHQIAFESSKHDHDRTRQIQHQFWCVEALANYLEYYVIEKGVWRLTHPRLISLGDGFVEGAFSHCKQNLQGLPSLKDFFATPPDRFMTVENYHMAATAAYFLLEGEGGRYRKPFLKLLERVHKVRDSKETLHQCFEGIDLGVLQRQWEKFVRRIKVDA